MRPFFVNFLYTYENLTVFVWISRFFEEKYLKCPGFELSQVGNDPGHRRTLRGGVRWASGGVYGGSSLTYFFHRTCPTVHGKRSTAHTHRTMYGGNFRVRWDFVRCFRSNPKYHRTPTGHLRAMYGGVQGCVLSVMKKRLLKSGKMKYTPFPVIHISEKIAGKKMYSTIVSKSYWR